MNQLLNKIVVGFVSFCCGLIILGLTGNTMNNEKNQKSIFKLSNNKETKITVTANEIFSFRIESNPSTGYQWCLILLKEIQPTLLKFKSKKIENPQKNHKIHSKQRLMGAPTFERFTFIALKPGHAIIKLEYRRPWEKNKPPLKTHLVKVNIEK